MYKVTIKKKYTLRRIDDLFDHFVGAFFSKIDLRSRYHLIRVREEDVPKTKFHTCYGHYEFVVMSFGMKNAPSTSMDLMKRLYMPMVDKSVKMFIADILEYLKTYEEHEEPLRELLETLRHKKFYGKFKKCDLWLWDV